MTMAKGIMIVDGQRVPFDGEKNVLSVIRKAGIDMPTFCYYSELSVHGACRMCIVENVKTGKIDASCSMEPRDGLEIRTNTARLLRHRRMILELMLASHDCSCTTCAKSGNCRLQALAQRFGVSRVRFPDTRERYEQDNTSLAIFRDPNKCILCGDCVRVCEELQGQGILNYAHRGSELQVMPAFDRKLADTKCVGCGQCAAVCTTGAITVKNQIGQAWQALHDPKNRVVVQIAPAVRVALGEEFGLPAGENVMDRLVKALKLMGVEEVYDTDFAADMTIVEEANGMPILVAYQFKHERDRILSYFKGSRVLDKNPQTIRDWNAGKIPMLLAHPASCGHGLSMQDGGNILVFYSTGWNLEEHEQIIERIGPTRQAQAGHPRPVFVYNIIAKDTLDEAVQERITTKRSVLDLLMERRKA